MLHLGGVAAVPTRHQLPPFSKGSWNELPAFITSFTTPTKPLQPLKLLTPYGPQCEPLSARDATLLAATALPILIPRGDWQP